MLNDSIVNPPKDKGNVVYACFFLLGIGTLFAWNAFISAANYFGSRFCGTEFEKSFEDDVASSYMAGNLFPLMIVVRYQHLLSRKFRVLGSFIAWFTLFVLITLMVLFEDLSVEFVYYFTLFACALCGLFNAICSGGIFGLVAQFPPIYVQSVMSGQGLSGLTAALVSMITAFAGKDRDTCVDDDKINDDTDDSGQTGDADLDCSKYDEVDYGVFVYFLIACIIFLLCIIGYIFLEKAEFAQYYNQENANSKHTSRKTKEMGSDSNKVEKLSSVYSPINIDQEHGATMNINQTNYDRNMSRKAKKKSNKDGHEKLSLVEDDGLDNLNVVEHHSIELSNGAVPLTDNGMEDIVLNDSILNTDNKQSISKDTVLLHPDVPEIKDYIRVLNMIKSEVFSVWLVFTVTLSIFPAITSQIRPIELKSCSKGNGVFSSATFTTLLFVLFNFLDLIGRCLQYTVIPHINKIGHTV